MSYKSEFVDAAGWAAIDTNKKVNSADGTKFRDFMSLNGVRLAIRYYASSQRKKTISKNEAQVLSNEGYAVLPVYQDNGRLTSDFGGTNGEADANDALEFVDLIGQPDGTTILFAVDEDFSVSQVNSSILPYFEAIQNKLGGRFRIGAYGSGLVLRTLLDNGLIEVPWLSMSRLFTGTKDFFYSGDWAFRQLPPDLNEPGSGFGYDRNVLNWDLEQLGAFRLNSDGRGVVIGPETPAPAPMLKPDPLSGGLVYVATEGLKFRDAPHGLVGAELTIGTRLDNLGQSDTDERWQRVSHNGSEGVAFARYLRDPSTPEVEALIEAAIAEWVRFDKGAGDEEVSPYREYVGEMWQAIGLNYDGASTYVDNNGVTREQPWSAAFVSFVVRNAGFAYENFHFSQRHSDFVHDAIQARFLELENRPFWGYRRTELKPEVGDIIQRNRGKGKFTFDWAETHSRYSSHSDIVVEVRDESIRVLGGNVGDTVTTEIGDDQNQIQEYRLTEDGYVASGQRVITLLKNRAHKIVK